MASYGIDPDRVASNRRRNRIHAGILIGSMAGLLAAVGWFIAGPAGLVIIAVFAVMTLAVGPRVSQNLMLQIYAARPLRAHEVPMLYDLVGALCERADIPQQVNLYYIPSRLMLAFTVGGKATVGLALSDGLLRKLSGREIAGVLAHELSHVAHHDLTLMALADFMTKVTRTLAFLALLLIAINLPFLLEGEIAIPWPPIVLLMVAPLLSLLLQLGLSRSREYDADAGAALLTGDPEAVASALEKMEAQQRRYWETLFGREGAVDQPSVLRTHPPTQARVDALAQYARRRDDDLPEVPGEVLPPDGGGAGAEPRRRFHGFRF
jgi:heat shock protein HtpX